MLNICSGCRGAGSMGRNEQTKVSMNQQEDVQASAKVEGICSRLPSARLCVSISQPPHSSVSKNSQSFRFVIGHRRSKILLPHALPLNHAILYGPKAVQDALLREAASKKVTSKPPPPELQPRTLGRSGKPKKPACSLQCPAAETLNGNCRKMQPAFNCGTRSFSQ